MALRRDENIILLSYMDVMRERVPEVLRNGMGCCVKWVVMVPNLADGY